MALYVASTQFLRRLLDFYHTAVSPMIDRMATRPEPEASLLELLATGASASRIATADADPVLRNLALRIRATSEVRIRRESELEALVDTAADLASMNNPVGVLDAIVRRARRLLGTHLAYLTLYDPERGDTYMRATSGSVSAAFQAVRLDLGAGLGGLVASTLKPYWTSDYLADERFRHTGPIDHAVIEEGIVSICGTPLVVKDEFVGVLFASNRTPRAYTRDEVALLGSLATLAAVAIVQVNALDRAARALDELSQAHEVVRRHTEGVERAAAAHDKFADLVLRGGGVDDITDALTSLLGGWVVLLDETGAVRSSSGTPPDDVVDAAGAAWGHRTDVPDGRLSPIGEHWVVPITAVGTLLGHLAVGGVTGLDEADRRTVERAAVVTALVLLIEHNRSEAAQQVRTDLVSDLLGRRGDPEYRHTAARGQGLDLREPYCVLVARAVDVTNRRSLVMAVSAAMGGSSLVGEHDGDVIVITTGDEPSRLANELAHRMSRSVPVTVGGAGPANDADAIVEAYSEARRTLAALLALGHSAHGGSPADLGFAGLIVGTNPQVGEYVRSVLGPLLDYDAARGTDLVTTVEEYFAAGSSPRRAAKELHVHVNTVAQRLDRVSRLLGAGWQDPDRALQVQLALHLKHLIDPERG